MKSDSHPNRSIDSPLGEQISGARNGCADAQGALAEHCRGYLLAVARGELDESLQPKVAISDVVQDALIKAQQGFGDFRGDDEAQLLGWMRSILLNQISDVRRKFKVSKKRSIDREVIARLHESTQMRGVQLSAGAGTPSEGLQLEEELDQLRSALKKLSEPDVRVIQLRNWEQLSFPEIAQQMDSTPDAVRMLWNRAVQKLGELMVPNN